MTEGRLCTLPTGLSCISGENPGRAQGEEQGPEKKQHQQGSQHLI